MCFLVKEHDPLLDVPDKKSEEFAASTMSHIMVWAHKLGTTILQSEAGPVLERRVTFYPKEVLPLEKTSVALKNVLSTVVTLHQGTLFLSD